MGFLSLLLISVVDYCGSLPLLSGDLLFLGSGVPVRKKFLLTRGSLSILSIPFSLSYSKRHRGTLV